MFVVEYKNTSWHKYKLKNSKISSEYKKYNDEIPLFL